MPPGNGNSRNALPTVSYALQREIRHWRAAEGQAQKVYYVQEHHAGNVCASDSIVGQSFPHMLYHFVLTYSNWETGAIYLPTNL